MANEIYKANDVQLRQQIKARLNALSAAIVALNSKTVNTGAIGDDAVWTYTFDSDGANYGNIIITHNENASNIGIFAFRANSGSAFCAPISATGITATTGALAGTTGSDGTVTVAAHTDLKIRIENRTGGVKTFNVTINSAGTGS